MKSFYIENIDNLKDSSVVLTERFKDRRWILINDDLSNVDSFIFRKNEELIISRNGKAIKSKWSDLGKETILIEETSESKFLLEKGYIDKNILVLRIPNENNCFLFVSPNGFSTIKSPEKIVEYLRSNKGKMKEDYDMIVMAIFILAFLIFAFIFYIKVNS